MGHRRRAREYALQMLFQIDVSGDSPEEVFEAFWTGQDAPDDVREFAQHLVRGTSEEGPRLDEVIAGDLAALNDTLTALGVDIIGA